MKKTLNLSFIPLLAMAAIFLSTPLLEAKPPGSVGQNDFRQKVLNADKLVVVEFTAPWCSSCRSFEGTFNQLSSTHSKAEFYQVNVDQSPNLASYYNIRKTPSILLIKNGRIVKRFTGAPAKAELDQAIQANY